jgi:hypothetical protein
VVAAGLEMDAVDGADLVVGHEPVLAGAFAAAATDEGVSQ